MLFAWEGKGVVVIIKESWPLREKLCARVLSRAALEFIDM